MNILTTDFHTHILPGIDDGSQSVEDSLAMLHKEQSDGVDTILLTPHFYPQQMYPDFFLEGREFAMKQLCNALPKNQKTPLLILGAEVQYCSGMSQWQQLDLLTIGDSKFILIEMPFTKWTESVYTELSRICFERKLTPIIAHIERYLSRFNTNRILNKLSRIPVLIQMNCEYLTNKHTQQLALKLIAEQKVHLIGSDCHSSAWRTPIMAQAREILLAKADQKTLSFLANNENLIRQ